MGCVRFQRKAVPHGRDRTRRLRPAWCGTTASRAKPGGCTTHCGGREVPQLRESAALLRRFGTPDIASAAPVGTMRWGMPADPKAPEHRRTPQPGGCTTHRGEREAFWRRLRQGYGVPRCGAPAPLSSAFDGAKITQRRQARQETGDSHSRASVRSFPAGGFRSAIRC